MKKYRSKNKILGNINLFIRIILRMIFFSKVLNRGVWGVETPRKDNQLKVNYLASAALEASATFVNDSGAFIAISARIFLSSSIFASFKPCINVE